VSTYRAVIFDLGGVVFPSPFTAFDRYDERNDLERGTVRRLIRTSSETGAWAALERGELTHAQFHAELEAEAEAAGFALDAARLMATIAESAGAHPEMLQAIRAVRAAGLRTGALTNNWRAPDGASTPNGLHEFDVFDVVVESAVVGLRKPDPRIYELVCERLEVAPDTAVFLDDLGINLKPARAMGMATIKVIEPAAAISELAALLGFALD
jgi:putative hydrolase of the HAD superfamily